MAAEICKVSSQTAPMVFFVCLFLITCGLAYGLPWSQFRHVILAFGLALILLYMFDAPTHPSDESIFEPIVRMALLILLSTIATPLLIRLLWAIHKSHCDFTIKTHMDVVMALATGLVLALGTFLQLSYIQEGFSMILAHGNALTLALCAWIKRHPITRSFAVGLTVLTFYSLSYPALVRTAALQIAPSGYTIGLPTPTGTPNLTFLTMPKFPHPTLHFERNGAPATLRWSYRRRAFLPFLH